MECCGGTQGPSDWENNIYFNCTSIILVNGIKYQPAESCGVPFSCCANQALDDSVIDTQCGYGVRTSPVSLRSIFFSVGWANLAPFVISNGRTRQDSDKWFSAYETLEKNMRYKILLAS